MEMGTKGLQKTVLKIIFAFMFFYVPEVLQIT